MTAIEPLREYRDDLPGAGRVAAVLGPLVPGTITTTVLGVLPLMTALVLRRAEAVTAAAALFAVVLLTASAAKPMDGALAWLVVPLVRFVDYATVIALFLLDGPAAGAATFAFLAPVVLHHYDVVYRLRHQRRPPPVWVRAALLGWQGRVLLAVLAGTLDAQVAVGYLYGALAGVVVVAEIVIGWRSWFAAEAAAQGGAA